MEANSVAKFLEAEKTLRRVGFVVRLGERFAVKILRDDRTLYDERFNTVDELYAFALGVAWGKDLKPE